MTPTLNKIKDYCDKHGIRYEMSQIEKHGSIYDAIGICNLAQRSTSYYQWSWFVVTNIKYTDDYVCIFQHRYNAAIGTYHKGEKETIKAERLLGFL